MNCFEREKRKNRINRKGFTLIELMVVVSIIGIMALLGLRIYVDQQIKAGNALLKGNVSTIHSLIQSALADNNNTNQQVWGRVDGIIKESGIHLPAGPPQGKNIPGVATSEPQPDGNGGWVFVFVDDNVNPTQFYVNGINSTENGWVFQNHLIAQK